MVRLHLLSLLAFVAGSALAAEQNVLDNVPVRLSEKWSYVDCGNPSDPIQLDSITIYPDPPKPGQDLTVVVSGSAVETVKEGAYADVTVKLGLVKLLSKTFDLCEEARAANTSIQCPVEEGKYTVAHTVALPKQIPQAKFTINVRGYTNEDDDLLCLDLHVDFMHLPWILKDW